MLSVENQKYLLSIANLYREAAILAVRKNQNLDDEYVKPYCIEIIENNDYTGYSKMNIPVKEEFMQTLMNTFCFIDPSMLFRLSDIVINAIENNNKASSFIHNTEAIMAIQKENKELQKINSMLIRYARTLNPDSELPFY